MDMNYSQLLKWVFETLEKEIFQGKLFSECMGLYQLGLEGY